MELPCRLPVRSSHLVPSSQHTDTEQNGVNNHLFHVEFPPSTSRPISHSFPPPPTLAGPNQGVAWSPSELMRVQGSRPRGKAPFFPSRRGDATWESISAVSFGVPRLPPCLEQLAPSSVLGLVGAAGALSGDSADPYSPGEAGLICAPAWNVGVVDARAPAGGV